MADPEEQYEVGYGKPPKQHQFRGGASGNPMGRPKGSKNLATIVAQESSRMVTINGPKGLHKVTMLQATVMQLTTKAAKGDLRAQRDLIPLVREAEACAQANGLPRDVREIDRKIMERLLQRMRTTETLEPTTTKEIPK